MIKIKQLTDTPFETIHEAFKKSFADYVEPFNLTQAELKYMVERRGCDFNLSFGAFHNEELVAITLNGIGNWNNKLTAYDTGTGVIKEYRKQGIATKMFCESLPVLRENGIQQYLLEVIKSNIKAYELYKKAGFKVTREFDYFISSIDKLNFRKLNKNQIVIKEIANPDWNLLETFWDFEPSWQNSFDSIMRKIDYFKIIGIYLNETLAGYGIIELNTGDIPQLAINKNFRRQGLGTELFRQLADYSRSGSVKIINSLASYLEFAEFMQSVGFSKSIGQYEMLLEL